MADGEDGSGNLFENSHILAIPFGGASGTETTNFRLKTEKKLKSSVSPAHLQGRFI